MSLSAQTWLRTSPRLVNLQKAVLAPGKIQGLLLDKFEWLQQNVGLYGEGINLTGYRSESDAFYSAYKPIWNEHFFEPLKVQSELMLAGVVRAAKTQVRAKAAADRLLTRLKQSRLRRFDESTVKLIGEIGDFLEIWLPGQSENLAPQNQSHQSDQPAPDKRADKRHKRQKYPGTPSLGN